MTTEDLLGHVGYALITVGMYFLAKREKLGWVFRFTGEAIWVAVGLMLGMSSIWAWGFLFLGIDCYGYRKWVKEENRFGYQNK
jgi:hypothetical protein